MKAHDLAFVITEDEKSLFRFCRDLRAKHALQAGAIKLEDGFDKSHFDATGQHDFDTKLEESVAMYGAAVAPTGALPGQSV